MQIKTDRKSFIKSLRRQGCKYSYTASILGISRQRVEQILRPDKHRARARLHDSGLKPLPCEYPNCGVLKTEAHHFDYSKPLEVYWLCKKHHAEFHKKIEQKPKELKVYKCINCPTVVKFTDSRCLVCRRKQTNKLRRLKFKTDIGFKLKVKERNENWRVNNPDKWREIQTRAVNKYKVKNPEKIKEWRKTYYSLNKKKYHERFNNYYQANREHILARRRERYAEKLVS